jgi:hypothetical protein
MRATDRNAAGHGRRTGNGYADRLPLPWRQARARGLQGHRPRPVQARRRRGGPRTGREVRHHQAVRGIRVLAVGVQEPRRTAPRVGASPASARGRQLVFVGAGPDSYAAELRSLAAELGIGDDLIFTGGLARRDGRLLPGRRPARLPVAQRDLRPAHPGGDGLRLSGSDLAGQLDAGNRGGAAILCDSADPASIAEALVAGVAPDRDRLRDMGLAGRPSSPGRPRPPRRSTSTARWPSADGGDEHRFLVNRPSRAPPELHAGVRLPWQAA